MTGLAVASEAHDNIEPYHWFMLFAYVCQRGNYGDGGESNMHSDRLKLGSGAEKTGMDAMYWPRIGIWDHCVHRGQNSYTPTAFGKL